MINTPETLFEGRVCTKGRIKYQYRTLGGTTLLCIEVKLDLGAGRFTDAMGQVIAELEGITPHSKVDTYESNTLKLGHS